MQRHNPQAPTLQQLTQQYHELQDDAYTAFNAYERVYQDVEVVQLSDKRGQIMTAREHLGDTSRLLEQSLDKRIEAYHHQPVDQGHQHWEAKMRKYVVDNDELERQMMLQWVDAATPEDNAQLEQGTRAWRQFLTNMQELKEARAQRDRGDAVLGGSSQGYGTDSAASQSAASEVQSWPEQRQPIRFSMPTKKQEPARKNIFGWDE